MLPGRLGLETARIPHADRHGLVWLSRGSLYVHDGTLRFLASESHELKAGDYAIPFQGVSLLLLGPGSTVSHDALRIMARHGTGLVAVGESGVRLYSAPPISANTSVLARKQVDLWADERCGRPLVARKMFAWRFGQIPRTGDLNALRGIEGARMRSAYELLAKRYGIAWGARRYNRGDPERSDIPNQALNHAAAVMEGASMISVAATGTIPQLGFIHEGPGIAFALDVSDLFRTSVTIPIAFQCARDVKKDHSISLERHVRKQMASAMKREQVIPKMIDRIKEMFGDSDCNA